MKLAAPAPRVEPAIAEAAGYTEEALAQPAQPVGEALAAPPPAVERAEILQPIRVEFARAVDHDNKSPAVAGTGIYGQQGISERNMRILHPSPAQQQQMGIGIGNKNECPIQITDAYEEYDSSEQQEFDDVEECIRTGRTSVAELQPVDFESMAAVPHEMVKPTLLNRVLPFTQNERHFVPYGELARYVVIKQDYIFIYHHKTDPIPLYHFQFSSKNLYPIIENPKKPHKNSVTINPSTNTNLTCNKQYMTILLFEKSNPDGPTNSKKDKLMHQFTFDILASDNDKTIGDRFLKIIINNTNLKRNNIKKNKKTYNRNNNDGVCSSMQSINLSGSSEKLHVGEIKKY